MLIPVAFVMSVGPVFSPFAALPLAQQVGLAHIPEIIIRDADIYFSGNGLIFVIHLKEKYF